MKIDINYLKELIREQKAKNKSILLAKPPSLKDIEGMVSEVLDEMVGKNEEE